MVIAAIQPGTFSPLTVYIPLPASIFSTVPRKVCSFLGLAGFLTACVAAQVDATKEIKATTAKEASNAVRLWLLFATLFMRKNLPTAGIFVIVDRQSGLEIGRAHV